MKLFENCLLACDIDGTLETSGEISPRSIEKIGYFIDEGGSFSLATGRSLGALGHILTRIDRIAPSVVLNGALIYDFGGERTLLEKTVPPADLRIADEVFRRFPEVGIELHCGARVMILQTNSEIEDHVRYEHLDSAPIRPEELYHFSYNKILYAASDVTALEAVRSYAATVPHHSDFRDTAAYLGGKKRPYLEQLPAGISKATALRELCGILGIRKGGYFAIGDYYNDLEMVLDADIGCFTAEAPEELRVQADFVAGRALDGAVADFIEHLAAVFR